MAVAKVIEIIAGSEKSFDDAVKEGVARATDTLGGVTSAWVKDQNVVVDNGKVKEYRVTMRVTFMLKPPSKSSGRKK